MKGYKLTVEVTSDDSQALGDALQAVLDAIALGKMDTASATDEWFYRYKLVNFGEIE
jgi:hypothetical protein